MEAFLAEVSTVQDLLAHVRQAQQRLEATNERANLATRPAEISELRDRAQADIREVGTLARAAKLKLDALDAHHERMLKQDGMGPGSPSARMRESLVASLRRKLTGILKDFSALRQRLHAEYEEIVERRVFTVTGERPEPGLVQELIATGRSEGIFERAMLEQGRGAVLGTVAEIQERHEAVMRLERSLMELHQVFLDLAVLVEQQGEQLDDIEAHVQKSKDYVAKGVVNVVAARKSQQSTRKWMCWGIIVALGIAVVVIVPSTSL